MIAGNWDQSHEPLIGSLTRYRQTNHQVNLFCLVPEVLLNLYYYMQPCLAVNAVNQWVLAMNLASGRYLKVWKLLPFKVSSCH